MNRFYTVLAIVVAALIGCSVAGASIRTREPPTAATVAKAEPIEVITLTISLFLLVDYN